MEYNACGEKAWFLKNMCTDTKDDCDICIFYSKSDGSCVIHDPWKWNLPPLPKVAKEDE